MDNNRSNSEYAQPPCAGCQGAGMPTGLALQNTSAPVPTIEDVASYNYMNPLQKQQFNQQLKDMGSNHPSIPSAVRGGMRNPLLFAGTGGAQMGGAVVPGMLAPVAANGMAPAGGAQMGANPPQFPGMLAPAAGNGMAPAGGAQMGAGPGQFPGMLTPAPGSGMIPAGGAQMSQPQRMPASPAAQAALLPTGTGGTMSTTLNPTPGQSVTINSDSLQYLNGFLRTQIGRPVLVDFLIGTNTLVDKSGTLLGVGVNYILLQEAETDDLLACDFYNIKFIKFYY